MLSRLVYISVRNNGREFSSEHRTEGDYAELDRRYESNEPAFVRWSDVEFLLYCGVLCGGFDGV